MARASRWRGLRASASFARAAALKRGGLGDDRRRLALRRHRLQAGEGARMAGLEAQRALVGRLGGFQRARRARVVAHLHQPQHQQRPVTQVVVAHLPVERLGLERFLDAREAFFHLARLDELAAFAELLRGCAARDAEQKREGERGQGKLHRQPWMVPRLAPAAHPPTGRGQPPAGLKKNCQSR